MARKTVFVTLAAAGTLLVGCGNSPAAPRACTLMAALNGITVDIDPPLADQVLSASIRACWATACRDETVPLSPATRSAPTTCTGNAPTDVCGAQALPTGGKHGFVNLAGMPDSPVEVTLTLRSADTEPLVHKQLTVDPVMANPNGPGCGGDAAQAGLIVTADKQVRQR
ncbi:hypothetical protein EV193_102604 [Herbihabitans rhizosphaerae]|uniref:Secreted protein n=1 Tax=Herbihabitans rhizosphaerae TaxID=1872711 RepID=A0A4V2EU78_9PSEU|nr:hypothetical protein [Herbihabitans rhizosphaerae]RZS43623.1 hypothetical protein EV193_102604 [Herbihabitans rhizosphaerae]